MNDRTEFINAATAQAFPADDCMIIHSIATFAGADWDLTGVIAAIESAREVRWDTTYFAGHHLEVTETDGHIRHFAVEQPTTKTTVDD